MNYHDKYKKYKLKYIILKNKQKGGENIPKLRDEDKDNIKNDISFFKDIVNKFEDYNKLIKILEEDINKKYVELNNLRSTEQTFQNEPTQNLTDEKNIIQCQIRNILLYIEKKQEEIDNIDKATKQLESELESNNKYFELKNNPLFLYIIGVNDKNIQAINLLSDYESAGIIFSNGRHILAGYQPKKKNPFISGIGGMKNPGETYIITAIRETLEELFDLYYIPDVLLNELYTIFENKQFKANGKYICVICKFEDLLLIFNLLKKHNIKSRLYDQIPNSLNDLVFERKINKDSEISELCILPVVNHDIKNPFVSTSLISDFNLLLQKED